MDVSGWALTVISVVVGGAVALYALMLLLTLLGVLGDNAKELLAWLEAKLPGG